MRNPIATLFFLFVTSMLFAQTTEEIAKKQYELKAYDKAITTCRKVLAENPKDPEAVVRLADSYFYTNDMKNALKWYKKAVELKADSAVLFRYAKAYMRSGDYTNAEKLFKAYAKVDPEVGEHYASYARLAASTAALPAFYNVKREYLNTQEADFLTTFFGNKIVYSSARTDIRRKVKTKNGKNWEGKALNQLFITALDSKGFLQKPKLLANDLQFNYNEGPVAYSNDEDRNVVITKNEFISGHILEANLQGKMTLLGARYTANGTWSKGKVLPINDLEYSSGFPSFAPDGKTLYFASNRPGGRGGYDIYVSRLENGEWTTPKNLGAPVNTPGDEITPFMDGNTLYFSSNWLPGLGGFDVYRAELSDLSTGPDDWTKVYHMGTGINSSYDDYGFIFDNDNNRGYFTSNRRGPGYADDIFKVNKISDKIEIVVINASDKQPLADAVIDFSQCGEGQLKTNKKGRVSFQALAGLKCDAVVRKPGFKEQSLKVTSSGQKKSKRFVVKLVQSDEEYLGKVVNNDDNSPIEQVLVTAVPHSGETIKTFTDKNGEFTLPLKKNESFTIIYSKAGFADVTKTVHTGEGKDRSILGIQPMVDAYSAVAVAETAPAKGVLTPKGIKEDKTAKVEAATKTAEAATEDMASAKSAEAATKAKTTSSKNAKAATPSGSAGESKEEKKLAAKKAKDTSKKATDDRIQKYAIQVAAYNKNDKQTINMSKYKDLFDVGNVYSRPTEKYVKIRVGVFHSKDEANQYLKKVKKMGYKRAFVTKEYLSPTKEDKALIIKPKMTTKAAAPAKPFEAPKTIAKAPAKEKTAKKAPKSNQRQYYVQLAAYSNTKYFPRKKVERFGEVVPRKTGKYTTMYLKVNSLEEAIEARRKAVALGFRRPVVVYKKNGKFVKMKF